MAKAFEKGTEKGRKRWSRKGTVQQTIEHSPSGEPTIPQAFFDFAFPLPTFNLVPPFEQHTGLNTGVATGGLFFSNYQEMQHAFCDPNSGALPPPNPTQSSTDPGQAPPTTSPPTGPIAPAVFNMEQPHKSSSKKPRRKKPPKYGHPRIIGCDVAKRCWVLKDGREGQPQQKNLPIIQEEREIWEDAKKRTLPDAHALAESIEREPNPPPTRDPSLAVALQVIEEQLANVSVEHLASGEMGMHGGADLPGHFAQTSEFPPFGFASPNPFEEQTSSLDQAIMDAIGAYDKLDFQ